MEVSEALELVFDYEENRRGNADMVADSGLQEDRATPMEEAPPQEVSQSNPQRWAISLSSEHKNPLF